MTLYGANIIYKSEFFFFFFDKQTHTQGRDKEVLIQTHRNSTQKPW